MKLRILLPAAVFFAAGIITGYAARQTRDEAAFSPAAAHSVVLDAGHGAPDGGAVGENGTVEKDINLAITQMTGEVLEGMGWRVIYTRTGDNGIYESGDSIREMKVNDMKKRREIMSDSGADLFVSIHMNSFENASASGLHIFYSGAHEEIRPLAEAMQERIAAVTGAKTHAVKTVSESLFLMKSPPLPCILAECGFLSNPDEERLLRDENYQSRIAWAVAVSVMEHFK